MQTIILRSWVTSAICGEFQFLDIIFENGSRLPECLSHYLHYNKLRYVSIYYSTIIYHGDYCIIQH